MKADNFDVNLFNEYLKSSKFKLSDGTRDKYVGTVRKFLTSNPDIDSIDEYNNFLTENPQYLNQFALSYFIKFKIDDNTLKNALLKGLVKKDLKEPEITRKSLTNKQISQIINKIENPEHQLIARLQRETGARAGDIIRLKKENIIKEETNDKTILKLIIIGKGKKLSTTYVADEELQNDLWDFKEKYSKTIMFSNSDKPTKYVFLRPPKFIIKKEPYTPSSLSGLAYGRYYASLKAAMEECGFNTKDWSTHDFRRDFARRMYEQYDKDIYKLQKALRHRSIETTAIYLRQSGLDLKEDLIEQTKTRKKEEQKKQDKRRIIVLKDNVIEGCKVGDIIKIGENISDTDVDMLISEGILKAI